MFSRFLPVIMMLALACSAVAAEPVPQPKPAVPAEKTTTNTASTATDKKSESKSALKKSKDVAKKTEEPALPVVDTDETVFPPYPPKARIAAGEIKTYKTREEDTLLDVARFFDLGYVEARAANLDVDPWTPPPGTEIIIPSFRLLPRARQEGIVVNLAEMRLYYFRKPGAEPETYPIGIGRDGLQTPTGTTTIRYKAANPTWNPTPRMREENPWLPASVPPGPSNPLGTHALYLGWPEVRIHGSNKPWAIGRRVSSGCMRMYPEDIIKMFNEVPEGTKVTVVDQPILIGRVGNTLYLEANPSKTQSNDVEIEGALKPKDLDDKLKEALIAAAGTDGDKIDWSAVRTALHERKGYPVAIATFGDDTTEEKNKGAAIEEQKNPAPTPQLPSQIKSFNN